MANKDTCAYCIEELCEKFENRGIAEKVASDAEKSKRKNDRAKKRYLPDGTVSPKSKKYKTGNHNGKLYTSSEDFARYYKDLRDEKLPKPKVREGQEYADVKNSAADNEKLQSKKEMRLAIIKLMKDKLAAWGIFPLKPRKFIEEANKGFREDDPQNRGNAKQKRLPRGVLPSILLTAVSLLLIVTSSVMVSRMESDVARLESRLEKLQAYDNKLATDLEVKNNMIDIKKIAEEQYHMLGAEYKDSRYLYIERDDSIDLGKDKSKQSAFIRLMEALGFR